MPITSAGLKAILEPAIKTELDNLLEPAVEQTAESEAARSNFAEALAKAISDELIPYLTANTVVTGLTSGGDSVTGSIS